MNLYTRIHVLYTDTYGPLQTHLSSLHTRIRTFPIQNLLDQYMYKLYTMYIMYTTSEFRTNIRKALDKAAAGEEVIIRRHDQYFTVRVGGGVQTDSADMVPKKETPKKIAEPKFLKQEYPSTKSATLTFCKHGSARLFCKYAKPGKPCKA